MSKLLSLKSLSALMGGLIVIVVALLPVSIRIDIADVAAQDEAPAPQEVEYTLRTVIGLTPPMAFVGVGGDIDGVVNPTLTANVGDTVVLNVINGDPVLHDLVIDAFGVATGDMTEDEQVVTLRFTVDRPGTFEYYCSIIGHREAGMEGTLEVTGAADPDYVAPTDTMNMQTGEGEPPVEPAVADAVPIIRHPADVPPPIGDREPTTVRVDLTTLERDGILADGTTFRYMTFDGLVPGPMLRIRVGDTVELHLRNDESNLLPHSIDLHAVTGPGGGASFTEPTLPGEENTFTFQALSPGLFVYHCATPSVAHHISAGMYGLILVEPEGGLPPVDREFYVMQGEIYTAQSYGTEGNLTFSMDALLDEEPEYLVFNGAAGALTQDDYALRAETGETVRIYFGVGGPNFISSFHVIGEIFDRVYDQASLTSPPLTDVQTTLVPPGGATVVEFQLQVPGRYILVDHALSRVERGLVGFLYVTGEDNPDVYSGG